MSAPALKCWAWAALAVVVLVAVQGGGRGVRTPVDQRTTRALETRFPSFRRPTLGDAGHGGGREGMSESGWGGDGRDEEQGSHDAAGGAEAAYMVMVDAGSSGSRAHVFKLRWKLAGVRAGAREHVQIPDVEMPSKKLKIEPGLSSYEHSPSAAGDSLLGLIEFAKTHVPRDHWSSTPFIVAATAGLRLLPPHTATAILDSCEHTLRTNSPFLISRDNVVLLSGEDEGSVFSKVSTVPLCSKYTRALTFENFTTGVYGWLSVNSLAQRLHGNTFSKVLCLVTAYSKYTRALTPRECVTQACPWRRLHKH
jgi:Golgi nucleoside diphosphatase